MAKVAQSVITNKFQSGDIPTGIDFAEFIENCYNVNDGDGTKFLADNGEYITVSVTGGGTTLHSNLTDTNNPNLHIISSITDLTETLDNKISKPVIHILDQNSPVYGMGAYVHPSAGFNPTPSTVAGFYYIQNRNMIDFWNGSAWSYIGHFTSSYITIATAGLATIPSLYFRTDTNDFDYYNGSVWVVNAPPGVYSTITNIASSMIIDKQGWLDDSTLNLTGGIQTPIYAPTINHISNKSYVIGSNGEDEIHFKSDGTSLVFYVSFPKTPFTKPIKLVSFSSQITIIVVTEYLNDEINTFHIPHVTNGVKRINQPNVVYYDYLYSETSIPYFFIMTRIGNFIELSESSYSNNANRSGIRNSNLINLYRDDIAGLFGNSAYIDPNDGGLYRYTHDHPDQLTDHLYLSKIVMRDPTDTIPNGSNSIFTLGFGVVPDTEEVFINGIRKEPTIHYNMSGNVVVFTGGNIPQTGETIRVKYIKP